jgi:hypothetical protein
MKFGLFGSAQARRAGPDSDSAQGFRDFIDNNVEAEALGYYSTFLVEHHFTGFGQVSASLNLLTWLGARTRRPARFRGRQRLSLERVCRVLRGHGGGRRTL